MKKLILSALAIVAFAGSTFAANTVEKSEITTNGDLIISVEKVEKNEAAAKVESDTPCADMWSVDYDYYRAIGYTHNQATRRANQNFDKCLDSTYGDSVAQNAVGIFRF
ncbi:hypothetical protein [Paenimyroides aestuarii]|uniref:Uncharacterized protein n=1 Tax=Paenimyroides aestuarii TaxID=2968490 RepID=A0ABY5NT22_9FLAO|nr:hypothetical protein [Paenimyroides aestuarii]UUV21736.1 hypothetical protein NPX36_01405 [Paenimyroides aestuarii]